MATMQITLSLSPEMLRQIEEDRSTDALNRSEYIRRAIREADFTALDSDDDEQKAEVVA